MYSTQIITRTDVHVWRTSRKHTTICTCILGSFIEAHLFGSMEEHEECDYDHTLIDDPSAQGGDEENCTIGRRQYKHVQGCCHRNEIDAIAC